MAGSKDQNPETQNVGDMVNVTVLQSNGSSIIIGTEVPDPEEESEHFDYPDSSETNENEYDAWLG